MKSKAMAFQLEKVRVSPVYFVLALFQFVGSCQADFLGAF
jgi:hypothetical protein